MAIFGTVIIMLLIAPLFLMNYTTNTVDVIHKNPPGLTNYTEIGWCPLIGSSRNHEPITGAFYVIASINGNTNDMVSIKVCHLSLMNQMPGDYVWLDGTNESYVSKVYVVSYTSTTMNIPVYFVKNNATFSGLHLIPKKK